MQKDRRKFMLTTCLVAGGAALSGLQRITSESPAAAAHREVSAVIASYGEAVEVTHVGQAAEYRVKMRGHRQFAKAFDPQKRLPFERIYVSDGNTLKFSHLGIDVTIVNVA